MYDLFFGTTRFYVVDVDQGNFCLWNSSRSTIIVDAFLPPSGRGEFVKNWLLEKKVTSPIDLLILTGWDNDHACPKGVGMLLKNFKVKRVGVPEYPQESESADEVRRLLEESAQKKGTHVYHPSTDKKREFSVGDTDILLFSPHPDDATSSNNASIVAKLRSVHLEVMITGDCEPSRWESIVKYFDKGFFRSQLRSEILVAPHHGSNNGITEQALKAIKPIYTLISVGENPYGFPHTEAVELYESVSKVLTTKANGTITCKPGGWGTKVQVARDWKGSTAFKP